MLIRKVWDGNYSNGGLSFSGSRRNACGDFCCSLSCTKWNTSRYYHICPDEVGTAKIAARPKSRKAPCGPRNRNFRARHRIYIGTDSSACILNRFNIFFGQESRKHNDGMRWNQVSSVDKTCPRQAIARRTKHRDLLAERHRDRCYWEVGLLF